MRRIAIASLAFALVLATPAARADDAVRLRLARELVQVARSVDTMRKLMPAMEGQMRALLSQQGQASKPMIERYLARFSARMSSELDSFADLAAQVWAREFDEQELSDLLAFYKTPTGQKLIDKQAEVGQAMMMAGARWGENIGREVSDEMQKEGSPVQPKL